MLIIQNEQLADVHGYEFKQHVDAPNQVRW